MLVHFTSVCFDDRLAQANECACQIYPEYIITISLETVHYHDEYIITLSVETVYSASNLNWDWRVGGMLIPFR